MIIATVKAKITPGTAREYLEVLKPYSAAALAAGCKEHLGMPTYNDDEFFQYELWDSMDDLNAFVKTKPAQDFQEARKPYFIQESKQVKIFNAELNG